MRAFSYLLRREFWENRGAFFTTPLAMGGVLILLVLTVISAAAMLVHEVDGEKFLLSNAVAKLSETDLSHLDAVWDVQLMGVSALFNGVLFIVLFFYLLGSLHDDRKDRSILFWKSLPISDMNTVLSKLVSASVVAPLLWIGAMALTQIVFMLIATVMIWNSGLSAWDYVWSPADPTEIWLLLLVGYLVQAFWMLPVWGWLLLASAFAKARPFLWAVVPPVVLIIFQSWLNATRYFRFDNQIAEVIGTRLAGGALPMGINIDGSEENITFGTLAFEDGDVKEVPIDLASSLDRFTHSDMWWGIAVGVLFIAAAIWIRRYRDEV
jgi:ABC-2 type transport system permease protein